MPTKATAGALR